MLNMDMGIISKEFIRPSSPVIHHLEPFKLSLLDQLFPALCSPAVLFYPTTNTHFKNAQLCTQLKSSLSQTLSTFYPLSGRVKDNLFIDNYEEGVQYTEARVKGSLFDFLKDPQIGSLNQFLPLEPFSIQLVPEKAAQVAVQVNIFDCGGLALGLGMSHKIIDGATAAAFLNSWAANAQRSSNKKIAPDFFQASMRFPPQDPSLIQTHLSMIENSTFKERKYITKRFGFDAKAIATLREKATSERVDNPSRIEALSSFVWKCCTEASRSLFPSPRASSCFHAVDIRQRTSPRLPKYSVGNLWFRAAAAYDLADKEMGLIDSVALTRQSFKSINKDYVNTLEGEKGLQAISNFFVNQLEEIGSKNPETFGFSSWIKFPLHDLDFGWGKPIWSAVSGEVGPHFSNAIIFKESGRNEEIEAWMILDENIMSTVERDSEFLKFASPNPAVYISVLNMP